MRYNLGCGKIKIDGYIGVDLKDADIVHNLEEFPFPFKDAEELLAYSLIEHINPQKFIGFMDACWDSLKEDGEFKIICPYAGTKRYWQDPTHCNGVIEETFHYFDPRNELYQIYEPKPWLIMYMARNRVGDLEVILKKCSSVSMMSVKNT